MQYRLPAPLQVSESNWSSVLGQWISLTVRLDGVRVRVRARLLGRTHEVLSGACATSLGTTQEHQTFCFSKLNKAATLHYHMEDIIPEICHTPKTVHPDRKSVLHNLTNLPPDL